MVIIIVNSQQQLLKTQMDNGQYDEQQQANLNTYRTQILILAILHVSAWGCLIRSDYNFVFLFFAYFYLVSKKDVVSINIIFGLVIMLQIMDIIFFIFVPQSWLAYQENNWVWNNQHGMHGFGIFIAVVVFLMKLPLLYLLYQHKKVFGEN